MYRIIVRTWTPGKFYVAARHLQSGDSLNILVKTKYFCNEKWQIGFYSPTPTSEGVSSLAAFHCGDGLKAFLPSFMTAYIK